MKPASAKAKGRKLQQYVRDLLLTYAPSLLPDDIRSTSMGNQGEDLQLSPAARLVYPYAIECKNVEALNIWAALEQAESHSTIEFAPGRIGQAVPLVVFKRNHSKTYVALELEEFLKLTRKEGV
ncbi:hypothetical protein UFOVP1351_5 [uncultured Caudovirales phage]|uniref:Uncharacterized protein n=1 Tax=uncultured Caudovirales phage TaxID=2100421 RepID=A0A6J5S0R6_9CAUD|nr:hypothetical protein UFOVP1351_5 [uncultured Caudovirales phage]